MSPIATGSYEIRSAIEGKPFIGRPLAEDKSLLPKRVVVLSPEDGSPSPWAVVKNDGTDTYTLKATGAPTAHIDEKLFAILLDDPAASAWKITPVDSDRHGDNAYIVTTEDPSVGWAVPKEEPDVQIAVQPLIVGLSDPPYYPAHQVFIFKRLDTN